MLTMNELQKTLQKIEAEQSTLFSLSGIQSEVLFCGDYWRIEITAPATYCEDFDTPDALLRTIQAMRTGIMLHAGMEI